MEIKTLLTSIFTLVCVFGGLLFMLFYLFTNDDKDYQDETNT